MVRTIRWMGPAKNNGGKNEQVEWHGAGLQGTSPVGLEGYCEFMEVSTQAAVIATFKSGQPILDGRPAATLRKLDRGSVIKLAFWPGDDGLLRLLQAAVPGRNAFLAAPAPVGVLAVPRTDHSLFIINTTAKEQTIRLSRPANDRISGKTISGMARLQPYEVFWLA